MPRIQDVILRHAQPRATTAKAAAFGVQHGGAGRDTTGQALYTGAWYYDGSAPQRVPMVPYASATVAG